MAPSGDADGLQNDIEVDTHGTDPLDADTDDDEIAANPYTGDLLDTGPTPSNPIASQRTGSPEQMLRP